MMRWLVSISSLGLVACGPDIGDPADARFEPLCGQEGPVELLALAGDEEVVWLDRIDDDDVGDVHVRTKLDGHVLGGGPAALRRNVVLDACGGVVAEVASGADSLAWWNDALVGCTGGDLVSLDGYEDASPTLLARQGCNAKQVGERWVAIDAEPDAGIGRLLALESAGGSVSVRTLVDALLLEEPGVFPRVANGEVFAQTPELAVYRVDPRTGALALELEQARAQAWSVNVDVAAYRLPTADPAEPSPLMLRDRRTGAEQVLDAPSIGFGWLAHDLLSTWTGEWGVSPRYFWAEPLRELVLPAGTAIERPRDDGRFLLRRHEQDRYEWLTWREGEAPQRVWSCSPCSESASQRSLTYTDVLFETAGGEMGLWRFDAENEPRLLGNELGGGEVLDDGRVLTVRVGEDGEHGPLLLADDLTDPESTLTLATGVDVTSISFTRAYGVPGELVYEATREDGTRTLQRARLAP